MEGVRQFSGYVQKYFASPRQTSLQAREFSLIARYYVIINGIKDVYACCEENSWQLVST